MATVVDRSSSPPAGDLARPAVLPHAPVLPSDAEFRRLQETDGSVRGYELENGRLVPMPPTFEEYSTAWGEIYFAVRKHLGNNPCGRAWIDLATYLDPQRRR